MGWCMKESFKHMMQHIELTKDLLESCYKMGRSNGCRCEMSGNRYM